MDEHRKHRRTAFCYFEPCRYRHSPLNQLPKELLVDLSRLERDYYERRPDLGDPNQLVSFGTSGHRGFSLNGTFTEAHILAITQEIYAESFRDEKHLERIVTEAQGLVTNALS